jgi:Uma2 family endonuclease
MASARHKPLPEMTASEFLRWPGDGSQRKFELVDGTPKAMSPAHPTHGIIQARLAYLLGRHLIEKRLPCVVVTEPPVVPRVNAASNVRVPDLGVSCAKAPDAEPALTDPVLLIEILSPSNQSHTWRNVWAYATIPSVSEILIIHSTRVEAKLLRRQADGTWPDVPTELEANATLTLECINLSMTLSEGYAGTRHAESLGSP